MFMFVSVLILKFSIGFAEIYEHKFRYVETTSKVENSNVYLEFLLSKKSPRLKCGSECTKKENCRGMEVCDGILCRLWNESFFQGTSVNASSDLCQRYSKSYLEVWKGNTTYPSTEVVTTANNDLTGTTSGISTTTLQDVTTSMAFTSITLLDSIESSTSTSTTLSDTTTSGISTPTTISDTTTSGISTPTTLSDTTTSGISTPTTLSDTTTNGFSTPTTLSDITTSGISTPTTISDTTTSSISTPTMLSDTTTGGISTPTTLSNTTTSGISTPTMLSDTTTSGISTPTMLSDTTTSGISTSKTLSDTTTSGISTPSTLSDTTTSGISTSTTLSHTTTGGISTSRTLSDTTVSDTFTSTTPLDTATSVNTTSSTTEGLSATTPPMDSTTSGVSNFTTITENPIQVCVIQRQFQDGYIVDIPCHNETYNWIVIQRRLDGSLNFNRNWTEYENGFGSVDSEIWLGNQYIHELTSSGYTILRIDMMSQDLVWGYVEYNFTVEDSTNKYRLHIACRESCFIDSLWYSDTALFSTYDEDNDDWHNKDCVQEHGGGGWWYSWYATCTWGNLNGMYSDELQNEKQGIYFFNWLWWEPQKYVRMMIRQP